MTVKTIFKVLVDADRNKATSFIENSTLHNYSPMCQEPKFKQCLLFLSMYSDLRIL